jgi:hypothetical protein
MRKIPTICLLATKQYLICHWSLNFSSWEFSDGNFSEILLYNRELLHIISSESKLTLRKDELFIFSVLSWDTYLESVHSGAPYAHGIGGKNIPLGDSSSIFSSSDDPPHLILVSTSLGLLPKLIRSQTLKRRSTNECGSIMSILELRLKDWNERRWKNDEFLCLLDDRSKSTLSSTIGSGAGEGVW